jgi:serine-type D-Ala-D-Ala carboxypeptidase/endopeptidase (penicillin-binding protein 4)
LTKHIFCEAKTIRAFAALGGTSVATQLLRINNHNYIYKNSLPSSQNFIMKYFIAFLTLSLGVACSLPKSIQTNEYAKKLYADSAIRNGHIGICVYDFEAKTYITQYQADKYFVPASNTKLFTCYTALKTFGDSLPAAKIDANGVIFPLGEPTLLSRDFTTHPLLNFIKQQNDAVLNLGKASQFNKFGRGWTWDDVDATYAVERNLLPIYNNYGTFNLNGLQVKAHPSLLIQKIETYTLNTNNKSVDNFIYNSSNPTKNYSPVYSFGIKKKTVEFPFPIQSDEAFLLALLKDTLQKQDISIIKNNTKTQIVKTIYSQPTDSVLKFMMHRSDNFYAEQMLLLSSAIKLDSLINERAIIQYMKKNDLKSLTQEPIWVDGSGLSRYNMFTPQNFVELLVKMKNEIGMPRLQVILPTGGKGTLSSLYLTIPNKIFAKTGTLTGHCALSGYLYTKRGKLLAFSLLSDNYTASAAKVRKAYENFILYLHYSY